MQLSMTMIVLKLAYETNIRFEKHFQYRIICFKEEFRETIKVRIQVFIHHKRRFFKVWFFYNKVQLRLALKIRFFRWNHFNNFYSIIMEKVLYNLPLKYCYSIAWLYLWDQIGKINKTLIEMIPLTVEACVTDTPTLFQ